MTTFPAEDLYPGADLFASALGGGIFARGQAAILLRLDGAVVAAFLGDLLIWDGTVSAFVSSPLAAATAQAHTPLVQSQPPAVTVPTATTTAAALPPTVIAVAALTIPAATTTAAAAAPTISASAGIGAPVATASAVAIPPLSDANINVPAATASAVARVPDLATTGSSNLHAPIATVSAVAPTPGVAGAATIIVPITTTSAAAPPPAVSGSGSITAPVAAATASATAPVTSVATFEPSGMTKNGTQAWATSATWVQITSWTANTVTYPGSSITSHRLVVQGTKTSATISAAVPYTGGQVGRQHRIRLVDQAGTQIGTDGATVTTTNGTCTVTATAVNLSALGITSVAVQMNSNGAIPGTISSGGGTFLTIT